MNRTSARWSIVVLAAVSCVTPAYSQIQSTQGQQQGNFQNSGNAFTRIWAAAKARRANRFINGKQYGADDDDSMPATSNGFRNKPINNARFGGTFGGAMTATQHMGNTSFTAGAGGMSTAIKSGNTTFINGPGASSAMIQNVGNTSFISGSGGYNATAIRSGNTTFINGTNGSSTAITTGSTTFVSGPGTRSGTIIRTGNTSFGNFNH